MKYKVMPRDAKDAKDIYLYLLDNGYSTFSTWTDGDFALCNEKSTTFSFFIAYDTDTKEITSYFFNDVEGIKSLTTVDYQGLCDSMDIADNDMPELTSGMVVDIGGVYLTVLELDWGTVLVDSNGSAKHIKNFDLHDISKVYKWRPNFFHIDVNSINLQKHDLIWSKDVELTVGEVSKRLGYSVKIVEDADEDV